VKDKVPSSYVGARAPLSSTVRRMIVVPISSWRREALRIAAGVMLLGAGLPCVGDEVARKVPPGFRPVLEYSLELHTLNLKEIVSKRREGKNPFTSERMVLIVYEGMSASEVDALMNILNDHKASVSDDEGSLSLMLANGTSVSIRRLGRRPHAGIQAFEVTFVSKGKFSKVDAEFLYQLAVAGNLALCSPTDRDVVATTKPVASDEFKLWTKGSKVLDGPVDLVAWMEKKIGSRQAIDPIDFRGD
jgi:hypothetical protein